MSFDDIPTWGLYGSDEFYTPFDDESFGDQYANAEPIFGDVTEAATPASPLFPIQDSPESPSATHTSSSDSESDWMPKGATSKGRAGNHNLIKKGEGRDAKKDPSDNYAYEEGFFYRELRSLVGKPPFAKLVFEICKVLREQDRTGKPPLEAANRWAKRRMPNAYAWLDRQWGKVTKEELLECLREAQSRLKH
jgi:hypothetical protein